MIISIGTASNAALASGALSLSEDYVLTLQAFEDYWNHLTPDGTLLVSRYEELPKLVATTRELFDRQGLGSPAGHLLVFRDVTEPFRHVGALNGILLQKSPIRSEQVEIMAARLGIGLNKDWGRTGPPKIYYSPFRQPGGEFETLLANLARSPDLERIYTSSRELIRPATDDRPFFNQRGRWSSLWSGFRTVLGGGPQVVVYGPMVVYAPIIEVTLVVLLIQAILVAGVMILLPLVRFGERGLRVSGRWASLTYFAGLGLGFILIEIVLLERFALYLGQPIYTFSVVLAVLLISTGAGSYLAKGIQNVSRNTLSWSLLAAVVAILLALFITPWVLSSTLGFPLSLRVTIALLLIAPLGVLLGVPFPTGLRLIGKEASSLVPWAWAVNGFFTVIGSVSAMILAMAFGFAAVHIIAVACYGLALFAIRMGTKPQKVTARLFRSNVSKKALEQGPSNPRPYPLETSETIERAKIFGSSLPVEKEELES